MSVKCKLYTPSGAMYVVPLCRYEYIKDMVENYFSDYCEGLLTTQELNGFVEWVILGNGGVVFGTKNDNGYCVVVGKDQ